MMKLIEMQFSFIYLFYLLKQFYHVIFILFNEVRLKRVSSSFILLVLNQLRLVQILSQNQNKNLIFSNSHRYMPVFQNNRGQYMSQPAQDNQSQSSYVRINKKQLENLQSVNQIEYLSQYRQQSSEEDQNQIQQTSSCRNQRLNKQIQNQPPQFQKSKKKSNWSNVAGVMLQESSFSGDQEEESLNYPCVQHQQLQIQDRIQYLETQKLQDLQISASKKKLTKFSNSAFMKSPLNNRKSQHFDFQKKRDSQFQRSINNDSLSYKGSPYRFSDNKTIYQSEFSRVNYRKMLERQIAKNKDLQRKIYKLESQLSQSHVAYNKLQKLSKKTFKQLKGSEKIKKQNLTRIRGLDGKLQSLKLMCQQNNLTKGNRHVMQQLKKQNKRLKQQNEKFQAFTGTLSESIFLLKGKKPKTLDSIWTEWLQIFEASSKNKWKVDSALKKHQNH